MFKRNPCRRRSKLAREILRNYILKYCPEVTLVGEASTYKEGLA